MLCFLSPLEVIGLLALMGLAILLLTMMRRSPKATNERHPQEISREQWQREIEQFNNAFPPHLDWLPTAQAAVPPKREPNPLDWIPQPEKPGTKPPVETTSPPSAVRSTLSTGYMVHVKPALFALSIIGVWFGFAAWYNNLNHYVPPTGDVVGDFRILYLKKTIGALLPLISAVGASLGLLFMIHPRYYIYLNGWTSTEYDFFTDLQKLDEPKRFRRVLVFALLFGLLLLVSLYVLLHSSPQELTL